MVKKKTRTWAKRRPSTLFSSRHQDEVRGLKTYMHNAKMKAKRFLYDENLHREYGELNHFLSKDSPRPKDLILLNFYNYYKNSNHEKKGYRYDADVLRRSQKKLFMLWQDNSLKQKKINIFCRKKNRVKLNKLKLKNLMLIFFKTKLQNPAIEKIFIFNNKIIKKYLSLYTFKKIIRKKKIFSFFYFNKF